MGDPDTPEVGINERKIKKKTRFRLKKKIKLKKERKHVFDQEQK